MNKPKILFIEDDPRYYEPLKYILEENGFDVVLAKNADEGISSMSETFNLAIVDPLLPRNNDPSGNFGDYGSGICRAIKAKCPNKPIIVHTNWPDVPEIVEACNEARVDEIIPKTRSAFYLIEQINKWLKKSSK